MLPKGADLEGGDDSTFVENQGAFKVQPDYLITDSISSPGPYDDDTAAVNLEVTETNSSEISNAIEQTEEGEVSEDVVVEDSEKSTDGNDQRGGDAEQINEANHGSAEGNMSYVESAITREDSPSVMVGQEVTQSSHASMSSTTMNLTKKAKERAAARLGRFPAPPSTSASSPAARRGKGGPLTPSRGGGRSTRGGHRQNSGDQGQS